MDTLADSPLSGTADMKLLAETMDPTTVDPQFNSPFFSVLPPEICTRIFKPALRRYPDPKRLYQSGAS